MACSSSEPLAQQPCVLRCHISSTFSRQSPWRPSTASLFSDTPTLALGWAFPPHSPALQGLPLLGGSLQTTLALLQLPQQGRHLGFHRGLVFNHLLQEKKSHCPSVMLSHQLPSPGDPKYQGSQQALRCATLKMSFLPFTPTLISPLTSRSFQTSARQLRQ